MDDGAYLFSYKFGGGNAKMFLELAGEVLGIFETEEVRGLADGLERSSLRIILKQTSIVLCSSGVGCNDSLS